MVKAMEEEEDMLIMLEEVGETIKDMEEMVFEGIWVRKTSSTKNVHKESFADKFLHTIHSNRSSKHKITITHL